jgi:DNA-directed RNA polymerase specialized sigma24 family protein
VERHTADKRSINLEEPLAEPNSLMGIPAEMWAREPSPAEAVMLAETLEEVLRGLKPDQRRMVELRLQGHTLPQIAVQTQYSLATVERLLDRVKRRLGKDSFDTV